MARDSFEATFAAGMGILGCIAGTCALIITLKDSPQGARVLVYDKSGISDQVAPYVAAGHNPLAVIDEAVARAASSGAIVIDGEGVQAPQSVILQLQEFVAIGSDVGLIDGSANRAPADMLAEGTTPMSAETIAAHHAAQTAGQAGQNDNPQDQRGAGR